MTRQAKKITSYRSEIGSFEKEALNKSFLYTIKEYDASGHILSETEFKPNSVKELEVKYQYDANAKMISKSTFYPLEETQEKLVHIYNADGKKMRDENYFGEDLFEKVIYEYDDKGNEIAQTRMDDEDNEIEKQEMEFRADGKISRQLFYANGDLEREVDLEYNENGICIKEIHYRPGDKTKEIIEYTFNDAGKKTSSTSKDAEGKEIGYIDVEFDDKMNPVKYVTETSGFYNSKTVNHFTYDEQNRVIENEFLDVLNNFLMAKEKILYDEDDNIIEQEIFDINPQAGMKKTHYRLRLEYEFYEE